MDTTKSSPEEYTYHLAPGTPGMVMLVFTIDGLDYVYKVIKDKFSAPKTATKQQVKDKYINFNYANFNEFWRKNMKMDKNGHKMAKNDLIKKNYHSHSF